MIKTKHGLAGMVILICAVTALSGVAAGSATIIADHTAIAKFNSIPSTVIASIGSDFNIFYMHTSHGSQIMTGLTMVHDQDGSYDRPYFYEYGDDLGHNGDTSWASPARSYLDAHPECNMAMFSWCGGCSDNTETGIDIYLAKMEELEVDYPGVIFIYMTGHLDGSGPDGVLYANNNQIRAYCAAHDKNLFDFADIESYDPDGVYYPDETDYCNWCTTWCAAHPEACPACASCAHSQCFNCFQKGKAWWYMMAVISGWAPAGSDCGDANNDEAINVGDAVFIIDYVFKGGPPSNPLCNGDANGDEAVNVGDAVYLINHVFKQGPAPVIDCCS